MLVWDQPLVEFRVFSSIDQIMYSLLFDSFLLFRFSLLRLLLCLSVLLLLLDIRLRSLFVSSDLERLLNVLLDTGFLRFVHLFVSWLRKLKFLFALENNLALDLGLVNSQKVGLALCLAVDMDAVAVRGLLRRIKYLEEQCLFLVVDHLVPV